MIIRRLITQLVNLGALGKRDVNFEVLYSPGVSESGRFGQPHNYDPGRASEIDILKATLNGLNITSLVERNSEIHDQIIDELDSEEREDQAERRKWNPCVPEVAR